MADRATLIQRGRGSSITSISAAVPPATAQQRTAIASYFHRNSTTQEAAAVLFDHSLCPQVVMLMGDKLGLFTLAEISYDAASNTHTVYGSFSDRLGSATPMAVAGDYLLGHFTSLSQRMIVDQFNLPASNQSPDSIDGPPGPGGVAGITASMARLNFGAPADANHRPQITVWPMVWGWVPGDIFPENGMALNDLDAGRFPFEFHAWRFALAYVVGNNGGWSVTRGGPLFNINDINQVPAWTNRLILMRVTNPAIMLAPYTQEYRDVVTRCEAFCDNLYHRLGSQMATPVLPPAGGAGGAGAAGAAGATGAGSALTVGAAGAPTGGGATTTGATVQFNLATALNGGQSGVATPAGAGIAGAAGGSAASEFQRFLTEFGTLQTKAKTAVERENDQLAADALAKFGVLFAQITNANSALAVTPGVLLQVFQVAVLKQKEGSTQRTLKEMVIGASQDASGPNADRMAANVTLDSNVVNLAFTRCFRDFAFLTKQIDSPSTALLTKQFSVYVLCPPNVGGRHYRALEAEQDKMFASFRRAHTAQEASDIANSVLYFYGDKSTPRDVAGLLHNIRGCFSKMVADFDNTQLWTCCAKIERKLNDPDSRLCSKSWATYPQVGVNLCMSIQAVFSSFVHAAQRIENYTAVRDGRDLSPSTFRNSFMLVKHVEAALETAIALNSPAAYLVVNPYAMAIFGLEPAFPNGHGVIMPAASRDSKRGSDNHNGGNGGGGRGGGNGGGANLKGDKTPKPTKPNEKVDPKKLGMLILNPGHSLPRECPIYAKRPGNPVEEQLCLKFLTVGYECAGSCNRPHIANIRNLKVKAQGEFKQWVETNEAVCFATKIQPDVMPCDDHEWLLHREYDEPDLYAAPSPAEHDVLEHGVPATDFEAAIEDDLCTKMVNVSIDKDTGNVELEAVPVATSDTPLRRVMFTNGEASGGQVPYIPQHSQAPTATKGVDGSAPHKMADNVPTVFESYSRKAREHFVDAQVSPRVKAHLNNPYGEEKKMHGFKSEAEFSHVWLPLWKSGFLHNDEESWTNLRVACGKVFEDFWTLLEDYGSIDFTSLRGFQQNWKEEDTINLERMRMTTAALLHFDGDVAASVRWMGGPHTNEHRDVSEVLDYLRGKVDAELVLELERILREGIPRECNASASSANFHAFLAYGNHSTADQEPEKSYKALVKDGKRGFVILADKRLFNFLLNCHKTPLGMVDLMVLFKSPRIIFDSSFRPYVWCEAINDWTHKDNEFPIPKECAEVEFMIWMYNLRITYPDDEIRLGDDDVCGAFRWCKYHPNLVAMHASEQCGYLCMNTGGTFGDNTTPSNWIIFALIRQQLARWLWSNEPLLQEMAEPHLPDLIMEEEPTEEEVAKFAPAEPDELNKGVVNEDGSRMAPPFPHHVDDCLYADVDPYMERAVWASTIALHKTVVEPKEEVPNPLSTEKLVNKYNHLRKALGRKYNSRKLTVGMCLHKREELIVHLENWLQLDKLSLHTVARILGILENHTRHAPWARVWFFAIQNALRLKFRALYHVPKRRLQRSSEATRQRLQRELPQSMWSRIEGFISRDQARILWNSGAYVIPDEAFTDALLLVQTHVLATPNPFDSYIGYIIPRTPASEAWGDACTIGSNNCGGGGGGFCPRLEFWFDFYYSKALLHACTKLTSKDKGFCHINSLEFVVIVLTVAATIQRFRDIRNDPALARRLFPNGVPKRPVLKCNSDNTTALKWGDKVTTHSATGQRLLYLFSELLRLEELGLNAEHIKGELNVLADEISRQVFTEPFSVRVQKLCQKNPCMRTWSHFLPSPQLIQYISSKLCSESKQEIPKLPSRLGQFVPTESISLCSPVL